MSDKNWPGLGFCPAPGDLAGIAKMYADVDAVARELEELRSTLAGIGSDGGAWEGEAARKFADKLGQLPKYLTQGHESMAACSRALKAWHTQLSGMITTGRTMEAEAVELRARLADTDGQVTSLGNTLKGYAQNGGQTADNVINRAQAQFDAAREASTRCHHQLDEVIKRAHKQLEDHRHKAEAAAKAIVEASRHHPPDPGLFKRMLDKVNKAWQKSLDFLSDHADILSMISAGLTIAALFTPFGPVLAVAAVLTSAGALSGHSIAKLRGKDVSWLTIGLDSLGVIPGIGAIKGFATAGKSLTKIPGSGLVNKLVVAPIRNLKAEVAAAKGSGFTARAAGAGNTALTMARNPLSTRAITFLRPTLDPAKVTAGAKAASIAHGIYKQVDKAMERKSANQRVVLPGPLAKPTVRPASAPFLNAVG
ncbi:hypothetical protein ACFU6K_19330 [Kitasatospora sp. NPDC057512]|uniref:hypothetical protein n=1 Tax=Kitasatospora sp. NPDC057512 TaxID=3346154 RepID=UPI0036916517